jgi:ubiquinone/menaquinone biosynthesis C-methylase UbiE
MIGDQVGPESRVLDIGCGHSELLADVFARTPWTFGLDPDPGALAKNRTVRHKVVGNADQMPFEDCFFDVVTLAWVLEHLERPETVFREIHRVLRPGGDVIFLTPNVWNYNVWMIRLIPNILHPFFTSRLYDRQEHDTYPTRYRMNSTVTIDTMLRPIGFEKRGLILNGDPSYISFNNPLFRLAVAIEDVLDRPACQQYRVHIIGQYRKSSRAVPTANQ